MTNRFAPTPPCSTRAERHKSAGTRPRARAGARFGREVFLRGGGEVSNFRHENWDYCGMRRDNRARLDTLTELLLEHRPTSITDRNIQAGEDPVAVREIVLPLIRRLRAGQARVTPRAHRAADGNGGR